MIRGVTEPCLYIGTGFLRVVVHVDDPIACGTEKELNTFWTTLDSYVLIRMCGRMSETVALTYLGREYRKVETTTETGYSVRHSKRYLDSCGEVYSFNTRTKVKASQKRSDKHPDDDDRLEPDRHTSFRSATGKLQFMGGDRLDIKYPTKCLAHHLATPVVRDERDAKHVMRYLQGTREDFLYLKLQKGMISHIAKGNFYVDTFTDSDWAGDAATSLSTSCCYTYIGDFIIEPTVISQGTVAQSTFEAEYLSSGAGAKDSLFVRSLLTEIAFPISPGMETWRGRLFVDSSSAKSSIERRGPSKRTRHLDVKFHFIQELQKRGLIYTQKILGTENPADLGTKFHAGAELAHLKKKVCIGNEDTIETMGPLEGDARRFNLPDGTRWTAR